MTSSNWGLSPAVIKRIYLSGFERSIVYAAKVWWEDIHNNDTFVKIIRSIQRPFALAICRGYNTLSTDAALFLSGLIPINLILNLEINVTSLKRPDNIFNIGLADNIIDIPSKKFFCNPADFNLITFQKNLPNSSDLTIFTDGSKSENGVGAGWCAFYDNKIIHREAYILFPDNSVFQAENLAIYTALDKILDIWQNNWNQPLNGRDLYKWLKFVDNKRILGDAFLNYFLTGHGPFPSYFVKFKIKIPSPCLCNQINISHTHLLFDCHSLNHIRPFFLRQTNPNLPHIIATYKIELAQFCKKNY
ncbi:hypothetical protein LAZ67_7002238 [Cordylochernes scorpioides]|uniref:RNase H type-1 domain-containing protein n=1 Tax=Cordylochernes scorpioides TaxID=51811 RepID=A0ABY6KNX9_9ARAC|nr:hypothetical protein LAZ67_7002238 [Cordylochernes scorpioides]